MKVLGRSSSHNVQKVMWCLAELGIDVERANVGGKFGGNKEESYLRLNPNGVVPTLVDGEVVVWESNSILRYLCNTRANSLYPGDAVHRSEVERWMDWQLTTLVTGMVPLFQSIVRTPKEQQDPEHIERHRLTSLAAMKILENVLSNREHLAASDFSLADICAGPSIYRWFELPIVRPPLPALERWYRAMQHRLGFREHVMVGLA
jgi:glutathione S-transferase